MRQLLTRRALLFDQGISKAEEVLLRFSLKESVYKAMHPLICQFVCFQEAEIQPLADGTADVLLFLKSGAHESLECVTAHWRRQGDFFLSSACARLKEKEWMARVRNGETCQV
jgi:4'-phosphopantetheinyl transferase EntD